MYEKLVVKKKNGIYTLPVEDILYIEKKLRKVCIHTQIESLKELEAYSKFDEILYYLDDRFLHCHRSYIINMDKIVIMANQEIFIEGNERVYLGRDSFNRAKKIFSAYLARKKKMKNKEYH